MIEGYIGRPGSGKSYSMTARAFRKGQRYDAVYANYRLQVPGFNYLRGPEDLLKLKAESSRKVLVLIDEVHLWLPARMAMKLPPSLWMQLSQTRKAGWDLHWAAQHESRVDRVLRDVTNWFWYCTSWGQGVNPLDRPLLFVNTRYEPERYRKKKSAISRVPRLFSSKIAALYDTRESLAVAGHVAAMADPYVGDRCEDCGHIEPAPVVACKSCGHDPSTSSTRRTASRRSVQVAS
ncbi:MAG: zonular occludens toxin domain-containing protein [Actinobacteria bacterium]|nr:zonular occludens toxin domain-containing protein [Actinomycetota bacterium]